MSQTNLSAASPPPPPAVLFDMERLVAIETACRACISQEPENMSARLRLAWCLIMRAFHLSGQEAVLIQQVIPAVAAGDGTDGPENDDGGAGSSSSTATQLLRSGLKQTLLVAQLSTNPSERNEAESLQRLVTMSGGKQAIADADEESDHIFAEVAKALMLFDEKGAMSFLGLRA